MASDNVQLLSYYGVIPALSGIYTEKVILSQYISLSIITKTDQNITLSVQFSTDGSNWDYSVQNSIASGSNSNINTPVLAKWVRLYLNNISANQANLRVGVYGTPSNSSIVATIGSIGNFDPKIDISDGLPLNAFGELKVQSPITAVGYVFARGTSGAIDTNSFKIPYTDLLASIGGGTNGTITFLDGFMLFKSFAPPEVGMIQGIRIKYQPGQGLNTKFTARFEQGIKQVANPLPTTQLIGIGNGVLSTQTITNFLGFGWINHGTFDNNFFGIAYYRDGVRTFIPRTSWNIDQADGTYRIPDTNFKTSNVYQITIQYLGSGNITFYIEDRSSGLFKPVHRLTFENTTKSSISFPELGFMMYQKWEAGSVPVTLVDEFGSASVGISIDGVSPEPIDRASISRTTTLVAATTTPILNIKCDTTFFGLANHIPIILSHISYSCSGNKPTIFYIAKGCTITGPAWITPYSTLIPMSYDQIGTVSAGIVVFSSAVGKDSNDFIDLDKYNMYIQPGDTFSILAYSAQASDITVCCNLHS